MLVIMVMIITILSDGMKIIDNDNAILIIMILMKLAIMIMIFKNIKQ